MKAIMISFDQALREKVVEALNASNCRGFTMMEQVQGRGSKTGEPHYGSHAWPAMNSAIFVMADDEKVKPLLKRLKDIDNDFEMLGLRAFVWNVEDSI